MPFAGKQTELEVLMLGKISQTQTGIVCFLLYAETGKKKPRHVSEK